MPRLLTTTVAACALALLAASCGDDGGEGASAPASGPGADLTVTVRPEGDEGPVRRRRIECERLGEGSAVCRRLAGLTPARFAPVSPQTACTEIYGGPAVASVRGELLGERVDARFDRTNGCEINRWDRNRALLSG